MYIEINDDSILRHIQREINDYYPYLRIEFYYKPHKKYEASREEDRIYPGKKIAEVKHTHVSGLLEITPSCTVADVEKEFLQRFGLSVQILKRNNDHWEQTTGMDDCTLKELNVLARNSSGSFILSQPGSEYGEEI